MSTRREFLKWGGIISSATLLLPLKSTASFLAPNFKANRHLFFSPDEFPEMRKRIRLPLFRKFWQEMLKADLKADEKFLEKEIQFNNQIRHLARADKILMRESFVYAMTGKKNRGDLARLALQKILTFKKWDYFLSDGKHVMGLQRAPLTVKSLLLSYEYMGDAFSKSEKEAIVTQLPDKGLEPCYRSLWGILHPAESAGWGFDPESSYYEVRDMHRWPIILRYTNLRAVPLSALGLGSLFLGKDFPRYREWMNIVQKSYDDFKGTYNPDGSYPEGTSYCRYTSQELILFLNSLYRNTGKEWYKDINWPGTMDFFLMTTMPSDTHPEGHVNFGDAGGGFGSELGFWTADRYGDAQAQFAAKHLSQYHTPFSIWWYNPSLPEKKPEGRWFYRNYGIGWVVITTGFKPKDFVLAMRSGGPANHEHADRNSVIVKCCSENLWVDNWHPPYNHLDPGWPLRTSPAHNTVLINGKGHQYHNGLEGTNASKASAKVISEKTTEVYAIVSSDATSAYHWVTPDVGAVVRTVLTVPDLKLVVVLDRLKIKSKAASFRARWFIDNEDQKGTISFHGSQFVFARPKGKLVGACAGSVGVRLEAGTFPVPQKYGTFPYLDIHAGQKAKDVGLLTAAVAVASGTENTSVTIEGEFPRWKIVGKTGTRSFEIRMNSIPLVPEFEVNV